MTFKTGDKGQTRGGDDYEVVAVLDKPHRASDAIIYIRTDFEGKGVPETTRIDGMSDVHSLDLLPPKQKIEGWAIVYRNGYTAIVTEEFPDNMIGHKDIRAIVPITIPYTEGEGLAKDSMEETLDRQAEGRAKRGLL